MTKVTSVKWSNQRESRASAYDLDLSSTLLGFGCGVLVPLILFITTLLYLYNQGAFK